MDQDPQHDRAANVDVDTLATRTPLLTPAEQAERRRERWEQTPDESWFSKWAPLPANVSRGRYVKPTRRVLLAVHSGLQGRVER
ncbi:hypothetical protein ACFWRG_32990 [Micromonospora tulbaghiae]|uniref:Uncharacterized protein n=2 Tax=Streptomyces TaxID=1883 RepID=A0A1E7LIJ5_9ACTN|nr:hypothetical protein [Streptomyces nanshensis]OEV16029.1 hypothetical protein AN221_35080 [Streptomyces nanshensis]